MYITGTSTFCDLNWHYFQLSGGTADSWNVAMDCCSGSFALQSPSSTGVYVKATSFTTGGTGTLRAFKNGVSAPIATLPLSICYTSGIYLYGPPYVNPAEYFYLVGGNADSWHLETHSGTLNITYSEPTRASVYASNGGSGTLYAVKNGFFVASINVVGLWRGGGMPSYILVYPNPVNDILTVEIDADAAAEELGLQAAGSQTVLTFDIRLYDGQGNLLQQQKTNGGAVRFNVSTLPDGICYLHVYDGVNKDPAMQSIVVEH